MLSVCEEVVMGVVVKVFPVELCMLCKKRKSLPLRIVCHRIDTFVITVYLCLTEHMQETFTYPLGILILLRVETVCSTSSKVFVYRVTADSLDRLSDSSHFCWNLRLAEVSICPNQKKHRANCCAVWMQSSQAT